MTEIDNVIVVQGESIGSLERDYVRVQCHAVLASLSYNMPRLQGDRPKLYIELLELKEMDYTTVEWLRELAEESEASHVDLRVRVSPSQICQSLKSLRIHRRVGIEFVETSTGAEASLALEENEDDFSFSFEDNNFELFTQDWREDVDRVISFLEKESLENATFLLRWITSNEDRLYEKNLVKPSQDLIPRILETLDPTRVSLLLQRLPRSLAVRILLDDYSAVSDHRVAEILSAFDPGISVDMLELMAYGVDRPARLAPLLLALGDTSFAEITKRISEETFLLAVDAAESLEEACSLVHRCPSSLFSHVDYLLVAQKKKEQRRRMQACRAQGSALQSENIVSEVIEPRDLDWFPQWKNSSSASGSRNNRKVCVGNHVVIEESLVSKISEKPVRIDILEIDPHKFRFECNVASSDVRVSDVIGQKTLEEATSEEQREELFRSLGFYRLSSSVEELGALAGICGGRHIGQYFFDSSPGFLSEHTETLGFVDPVDWCVSAGRELRPPIHNRCAFIVGTDGRVHICREKMKGVSIGEVDFVWRSENHDAEGVRLFNTLWGAKTPAGSEYVDLAVTDGKVCSVSPGGDAHIPLAGFVVSLPRRRFLDAFGRGAGSKTLIGRSVRTLRGSYSAVGGIASALACGPQLVRDGNIEVDFRKEEFFRGQSASSSKLHARLFSSHETSRCMVAKRGDGVVLLVAVSGRPTGSGSIIPRAGMTFYELAQLAHDLGAEDAMALVGGKHSALALLEDSGEVSVLNHLSKAQEQRAGLEPFLSSSILVFPR